LLGAWRNGTSSNFDELYIFTDTIGYYVYDLTKQATVVDTANQTINLAIPNVNGGVAKGYLYELNASKQLVIKESYFTNNQGDPLDFAFTRIEGSSKTGIYDIWRSAGRPAGDPFQTLLIIREGGAVYTSVDMMTTDWDPDDGNWVRAQYSLVGVTGTKGIIHWEDGSAINTNFAIDSNELTIDQNDPFTKINL
jgi:hypothetical protein